MEKLSGLLSDKESVRQLSELAEMINNQDNEQKEGNCEKAYDNDNIPDIGKLIGLAEILGTSASDNKDTELLLALRPHLSEERRKRVDKAVKMLKMISVISAAKDSGLLDDLI